MMASSGQSKSRRAGKRRSSGQLLRIGYVRLVDAAPFLVASEQGIFERYGLKVELSREVGWATIREKITFGELDAVQAVAPLPVVASLGLHDLPPVECLTSLVLNLNGNAITLAKGLVENAEGTRAVDYFADSFDHRKDGKPMLGVVSLYSSHYLLLRKWLSQGGLSADRDVHVVVLPPPQMASMLRAGHLDGYCAGEPWNTVAEREGSGSVVATSKDISDGHPEKVLMVRHDFAHHNSRDHIHLIAALLEACEVADSEQGRLELPSLLAQRAYLDCLESDIATGFAGLGSREGHNSVQFSGVHTNCPTRKHASWLLEGMQEASLMPADIKQEALIDSVFASEFFDEARKLFLSQKL